MFWGPREGCLFSKAPGELTALSFVWPLDRGVCAKHVSFKMGHLPSPQGNRESGENLTLVLSR